MASKLDEKTKGHKKSKGRVTLLCCSNATGEHKLPLMLIGKSAKPRALKNISINCLSVLYRSPQKAWMSADLFKNWFFHYFIPNVKKYLTGKGLPLKAMSVSYTHLDVYKRQITSHTPPTIFKKSTPSPRTRRTALPVAASDEAYNKRKLVQAIR